MPRGPTFNGPTPLRAVDCLGPQHRVSVAVAIVSANVRMRGESLHASAPASLAGNPDRAGWQNGKRVLIIRINLAEAGSRIASGAWSATLRSNALDEPPGGLPASRGTVIKGYRVRGLAAKLLDGKFLAV
jgi:hypothetical protein